MGPCSKTEGGGGFRPFATELHSGTLAASCVKASRRQGVKVRCTVPRGKHARCTGSSSLTGLRLALVLAVCWPALVLVGSPGKNLPASAGLIFQSGRPEECSPFSRWSLDPSEIDVEVSRCYLPK